MLMNKDQGILQWLSLGLSGFIVKYLILVFVFGDVNQVDGFLWEDVFFLPQIEKAIITDRDHCSDGHFGEYTPYSKIFSTPWMVWIISSAMKLV